MSMLHALLPCLVPFGKRVKSFCSVNRGCMCLPVVVSQPELFEQMEAAEKEAREKENEANAALQRQATERDSSSGTATEVSQTPGPTPIFYGTIPATSQPGAQTTTTTTTTRIEVTTTVTDQAKQNEGASATPKERVDSSQGGAQSTASTNTEKIPVDSATVQKT